MFGNLIKVKKEKSLKEFVVRKTWIYLIGIISLYIIGIATIILLLTVSRGNISNASTAGKTLYTIGFSSLLIVVNIIFYSLLFRYFYKILIIDPDKMVNIRFGIFFISNIQIIEVYRIQSIESKQTGFLKFLFNYGTIIIKIQTAAD